MIRWDGTIEINGKQVQSIDELPTGGKVLIHLLPVNAKPVTETAEKVPVEVDTDNKTYVITVKAWMTQPSTPSFTFMEQWNKNIPMPLRTMVGTIEKETPRMYYMSLHGDIISKVTQTCMKCGKPITNAVSRYFGLGPVCGGHNYVNPFDSDEELKNAVAGYRLKLNKMTWEGWIPKKAIETMTAWKGEENE